MRFFTIQEKPISHFMYDRDKENKAKRDGKSDIIML